MNSLKPYSFITYLAFIMLPMACSSHIPAAIKQPVPNAPSIQRAQLHTSDYIGQPVRWGGKILQIENKQDASTLSIIGFPLNSNGRPILSGESTGRFIAVVDEFLEPVVYKNEREITVSGTLLGTESRKIGEFSYDYPVVKVEHYYLWPVITIPDTYYRPYNPWYDPWYDPWYYYSPRPHIIRNKTEEK